MGKKYIVCEKMESDDQEGTVVGWGSRPTIDRDKELIEPDAWNLDNYRKNPVLLLCHNYSMPPVGKCLWVKASPQGLRFKAQFAKTERGRECYSLYKDGVMNAFSVGFRPRPGGVIDNPASEKYKGVRRVFTDVDLMEISCVPIPANSDALAEHVKAGKIITKQLQDELELVLELVDDDLDAKNFDDIEVKVETTDDYIHVPSGAKGDHSEHKVRTITVSSKEGIKGVYCVDCKEIISYIFDKEKWDKEKAVEWVEKHKKQIDTFAVVEKGENEYVFTATEKTVTPFDQDGDIVFEDEDEDEEEESANHEKSVVSELEALKEIVSALEKQVAALEMKTVDSELNPSLYDLVSAISNVLNRPLSPINLPLQEGTAYKDVIDIFTTQYPSGHVVFSVFNQESKKIEYFRVDYTFDMDTRMVKLEGEPKSVLRSWVEARYEGQKEMDDALIMLKSGRTLSSKTRSAMQAVIDSITELLEAADAKLDNDEDEESDEKEFVDLEEKADDLIDFDFESKAETDDEGIDMDEDELKEMVSTIMKNHGPEVDIKQMIKEAIAKVQGKVTID